jgi:hypothetical protein
LVGNIDGTVTVYARVRKYPTVAASFFTIGIGIEEDVNWFEVWDNYDGGNHFWTDSDEYSDYGWVFPTRPQDGEEWTWADINNLQVGWEDFTDLGDGNLTQMWVEVEYETLLPTGPSNLNATGITSTEISLSWRRVSTTDYTVVQYKVGEYPVDYDDGTDGYNGTLTYCTITGLTSGTTYYFRAWGSDGVNYSVSYAEIMITTLAGYSGSAFTPPGADINLTPDMSAHSGEFWYPVASWLGEAYQFESTGMFLRVFGMLLIAFLSIVIAYATGNLLVTLIATVAMLAMAHVFGIVPFWAVAVYGIIAGSIAYVKGNAHA